jgi:hypothetical protein
MLSDRIAPSAKYQHFVITRYFVRFSSGASDVAAVGSPDLAWLESRFEIFRDICLPSVAAQSDQNFVWLLYFDENTPSDYLSRIRDVISPYPHFRVVLCGAFDDEARARCILSELSADTQWLLTTRLDNDDGWRRDFVERLHAALRFEGRECLNFTSGLIWSQGLTLLYRHRSNAFISMLEPVESFRTVWCVQHLELDQVAPIRQIDAPPAFIQVIHTRNRSNKPRGARVPRRNALQGFEMMRLPVERNGDEPRFELWLYNLTRVPFWTFRDAAAEIVRRLGRRAGNN